jgi:hypothetical protein
MSLPLEGSRDTGEGIIVSMYPDVCKTPVGPALVPIPYSIYAKQNDTASGVAETVHQTSQRSHKLGSLVTTSHGDAPGTGKGVKSGTVENVCTPKTFSQSVRIEGMNAVRHTDEWWMNNRNTVGKLNYVKVAQAAGPLPVERPYRQMERFAQEQGYGVTATTGGQHNVGSAHYEGRAVDVRTRDHTPAQVEEFMREARARGFSVRDERQRPRGQAVWSGPHVHLQVPR